MERNLSSTDRLVRMLLGVSLLGLGLWALRGAARLAAVFVGGLLVFSGSVGFCHVYKALGLCTARESECAIEERAQ